MLFQCVRFLQLLYFVHDLCCGFAMLRSCVQVQVYSCGACVLCRSSCPSSCHRRPAVPSDCLPHVCPPPPLCDLCDAASVHSAYKRTDHAGRQGCAIEKCALQVCNANRQQVLAAIPLGAFADEPCDCRPPRRTFTLNL